MLTRVKDCINASTTWKQICTNDALSGILTKTLFESNLNQIETTAFIEIDLYTIFTDDEAILRHLHLDILCKFTLNNFSHFSKNKVVKMHTIILTKRITNKLI